MTENTPFLNYLLVQNFGKDIVGLEKFLKDLVSIVVKSIAPLEFSLDEEPLLQFLPSVLVVECSFDGVTQDLISLRYLREVMLSSVLVLLRKFRMPPQY